MLAFGVNASPFAVPSDDQPTISTTLVISQFQTGGSAIATDEFIEIHNVGLAPIDLSGYRIVYRSQNGTNDVGPFGSWTTSTILQPGQYVLSASTSYDGTVTPDVTWNPSIGSMSGSNGGLALKNSSGTIIDAVGWGSGSNTFFEGTRTTAPGNDNSSLRKLNGCQDTDNNSQDFAVQVPAAPRNSSSATAVCSGGGATLFASMAANPSSLPPESSTLLTVSVVPASTPPSTGITVSGDLTEIGGAGTQMFFDDGTHGDVSGGDNIFSFLALIPAGTTGGNHVVTAVAADAQGRTVPLQQNINVTAALPDEDPLSLGNPSGATANIANENNYLMPKPQYTLSYNRSKATANWVAWRLDSTWIGTANRQDDFRPDPALPSNWYHVTDGDYSGSGFQRGHMCPSGDRTRTEADNSATFLMTNIVPQSMGNNEGPWADFENYCRTLTTMGNEIYIISGTYGNAGTIASGRVVIPSKTWKVVLILPNGSDDVHRVTRATRAFGIIVPNVPPPVQNTPWRQYRTTVNSVEYLTGYNFFDQVPKITQELIERHRDKL